MAYLVRVIPVVQDNQLYPTYVVRDKEDVTVDNGALRITRFAYVGAEPGRFHMYAPGQWKEATLEVIASEDLQFELDNHG